MYTIKDMVKMFELPASTIRYYEEIGLLENVKHVNRYRRAYDDSHVERLRAIDCFKKARLKLDDIRQFFEYEQNIYKNSGKIVEMMRQQELSTQKEMENLREGLEHIQRKIRYYTAVDTAVQSGKQIPKWEEIVE